MMIPLNLTQIKSYLEKQGAIVQLQKETDQLAMMMKIGKQESPLFFRIYEGGELLQILAFLPLKPKAEAFNDAARLLHFLNTQIDIPGFGLDESTPVIFYRCMVPVRDNKIDEKIFDAYFNTVQNAVQAFAGVIAAVGLGAATFEEVLSKSQELSKEN